MNISAFLANKTYKNLSKSFTRRIIQISIAATALSLSVIIIAQAVFSGFQKEIAQKVFGFWGHIHITDMQVNRSIEPIPMRQTDTLLNDIQSAFQDEQGNHLLNMQSFVVLPGILSSKNNGEGLFLKGIDQHFDWQYFSSFLKKGNGITIEEGDFVRTILLSEQTARNLQVDTGQSVIAHFVIDGQHIQRKLKVCGIYRTGLEEYDKKFALCDLKLLQHILQWKSNQVTGLEVFVNDVTQVEKWNDKLYKEVLPTNFYSESIRSKFPNIFEWLSLQDINKRFILILVLLVCIINMATMLMILMLERVHMIGVLSALGLNLWEQRKIFIRYAAFILIKSMLIGNLIGIGLCAIQKKWELIKLSEADYYLDHAPVDLNVFSLILTNALFFIVVILFLLLPSYYISRIKPVNALKFR